LSYRYELLEHVSREVSLADVAVAVAVAVAAAAADDDDDKPILRIRKCLSSLPSVLPSVFWTR